MCAVKIDEGLAWGLYGDGCGRTRHVAGEHMGAQVTRGGPVGGS